MNVIEKILQENLTIESENLLIYPCYLEPKTILDLYEIYSDEKNVIGYTNTFNDHTDFIHFMMDKIYRHQNELKGYIAFIIELKSENKIIGVRNIILDGVYNYKNLRMDNNENVIAEIIINRKYWRNNYATESSNLIFNYLKTKGIKRVATFIHKNNISAQRMSFKLGFNEIDSHTLVSDEGFNNDFSILCSDINNSNIYIKHLTS